MRLIKSMPLIVAAVAILFTGSLYPSHLDALGQNTQTPGNFHGTQGIFQADEGERGAVGEIAFTIEMVPDETNAARGIHTPIQAGLDLSDSTASFVIDYIPEGETDYYGALCLDPPGDVQTAFAYAASIWGATIHSTVPITIRACWADSLGPFKLGYSYGGLTRGFPGAPLSDTFYMFSLANALHGSDLNSSGYDMNITYNSQFDYYFGLDATTPEDVYDFVTLALHEIGHGLNFTGIAFYNSETGDGFLGSDSGTYSIYDTFMYDGSGMPLTSYTSPSPELGDALHLGNLWFHGPNAMAANSGDPVKMYAPSVWRSGSSYVHLDYDTFNSSINSLMVYALSRGSANHDTGPITRGLLQDLGWPDRLLPYPPEIVWASDGTFDDRVRISWDIPSCATHYEVHRKTTDDPIGTTVLIDDAATSPFDDYTATPGVTYYYWVKACNSAGCSELSDSDAGTRAIIPVPEIPTGVNASDGTYTDMVWITWNEPAYATYYRVYRDIDDSIAGATLLSDAVITNEYGDTSAASILYYYWVRACNAAGCSGYSTPDSGYIAPTGPAVPTGLEASDGTYKAMVVLNWNDASGAKKYMVFRNTSDTTTDAVLLSDNHTSNVYEDTSASPSTDYYYWVRACDSTVCSGYSSSDLGYLYKEVPAKPSSLTASDGQYLDRVHLNWTETDNTDYYRILRNETNSTSGVIEVESTHPINSYDDLFVISGITYYYFIMACNADGCSPYSNSDPGFPGYPNRIFLPLILE